jgi:hypothetical protein
MKEARLRISLDDELDAAIMEKMMAEYEQGLELTRAQCLVFFARLGVKAWRDKSSPPARKIEQLNGDQSSSTRAQAESLRDRLFRPIQISGSDDSDGETEGEAAIKLYNELVKTPEDRLALEKENPSLIAARDEAVTAAKRKEIQKRYPRI